MATLQEKIASLEPLRATMGDEWVDGEIAKLRQHDSQHTPARVNMEIAADGSSRVSGNELVYVAPGATLHKAPPDSTAAAAERALDQYLYHLQGSCRSLQLGAIDSTDLSNARPMHLAKVYIGLNTTRRKARPRPKEQNWRTSNKIVPVSVLEVVQERERRLLLLGEPGAGKSTFVSHLLLCLAAARLNQRANRSEDAAHWLAQLPGWNAGALLPVPVVLRDLAAWLPDQPTSDAVALLKLFLEATYPSCTATVPLLVQALYQGQAILLLDGLDEVVGDAILKQVATWINRLNELFAASPIVVTCRVRDYHDNPRRKLAGFPAETLDTFSEEQINAFIQGWYAELQAGGREARGSADALERSIASRGELRRLAGSPLLLTMMAVVHASKGELPHARALLYADCIELLLFRWRQPPEGSGKPGLLERLNIPGFTEQHLLLVMAELGFAAHTNARRDARNADKPADLSEAAVREVLNTALERYLPGNDAQQRYRRDVASSLLLHEVAGRNGLLLQRSSDHGGVYGFPHRTFQEFLAAFALANNAANYKSRSLERAAESHWHEVLLLMVSYQVLNKLPETERPRDLVEALLNTGQPLQQVLAGELLLQIGELNLRTVPGALTATGIWGQARRALLRIATDATDALTPALRVRAATALGTLCFGRLETLATPSGRVILPHPRLPLALVGPQTAQSQQWRTVLEGYWCNVPAGLFWFGDDRESEPLEQMRLDYDFQIGRYPVTNADYARFVAADGYDLARPWWTAAGRLSMQVEDRSKPGTWDDPNWMNPLQPVTGITWYEAVAYCNWLTLLGHRDGWLARTRRIRLPTSLEWEKAARGSDRRLYPWGTPRPTPQHANYRETGIGRPSPVGCFPQGNAPCGAADMAGNVMEWLATPRDAPTSEQPLENSKPNAEILLSIADYRGLSGQLFYGARYWGIPLSWSNFRGFRCVQSLALVE